MGNLLQKFNFDRNAFWRTPAVSAETVAKNMQLITQGQRVDNVGWSLASYLGVLTQADGTYRSTELGSAFLRLYQQDKEDAWRWLITRALWKYILPNGTNTRANKEAIDLDLSFAFFRIWLGVLIHLSACVGEDRYLYYEELCAILDEDANWALSSEHLFEKVLQRRQGTPPPLASRRGFLTDLEIQYKIPRDNFNGLFNKAFAQTGLFEYAKNGVKIVGIAISAHLDPVLQRRIRFILDNLPVWDNDTETWSQFLDLHAIDLPEEVALLPTLPNPEELPEETPPEPIEGLVAAATAAFNAANLIVAPELVQRFVASLLAKHFLILTGLSGSGKTKLAQAFAIWITPQVARAGDCFLLGTDIQADKISYFVKAADHLAVELWNDRDPTKAIKVTLPRELIAEWVAVIEADGFTRETSPRTIRDEVGKSTKYSTQLNSFESQLKAAAFAVIDCVVETIPSCYEVVSVGADWTSNEHILGYADALDPTRYSRTRALDLILRAAARPHLPHFLILDEMNLSHVERYFADLLSAIESGESLRLHGSQENGEDVPRDGVPPSLRLPPNLFIIGTVNVDETTYMFSPKVLDRANAIEFRVTQDEMIHFLQSPRGVRLEDLNGTGAGFARTLMSESYADGVPENIELQMLNTELLLFFDTLAAQGAEFGFRTAKEIARFVYFHKRISEATWDFRQAMDAQILQKLLPKLHGSRKKLEPILVALAVLCYRGREWDPPGTLKNAEDLRKATATAARLDDEGLHPLAINNDDGLPLFPAERAWYQLSYEKIVRMLELLDQNGFASFAEA